jgi:hypothetical protein
MKTKEYCTIGTVQKSYRKIVKRGKIDTHITLIHDLTPCWLDAGVAKLY